ncbi:uncharacterized protein METZ01_LOCUS239251, partial [marine metagenome]
RKLRMKSKVGLSKFLENAVRQLCKPNRYLTHPETGCGV